MKTYGIIVTIALIVFLYVFIFTSSLSEKYRPNIVFETTEKIINEAFLGTKDEVVFVFKNSGKDSLYIIDVSNYCGCIVLNWNNKAIAPGSSDSIKIIINHRDIGKFTKHLNVFSTGSEWPIELKISGEVH